LGDKVTDKAAQSVQQGIQRNRMTRRQTMPRNEGTLDRALRIITGLVLLSLVFVGPQTAWGWIGLVPLATGLVGYCPLYRLLGINTCAFRS
jgi:hypothetical protein